MGRTIAQTSKITRRACDSSTKVTLPKFGGQDTSRNVSSIDRQPFCKPRGVDLKTLSRRRRSPLLADRSMREHRESQDQLDRPQREQLPRRWIRCSGAHSSVLRNNQSFIGLDHCAPSRDQAWKYRGCQEETGQRDFPPGAPPSSERSKTLIIGLKYPANPVRKPTSMYCPVDCRQRTAKVFEPTTNASNAARGNWMSK